MNRLFLLLSILSFAGVSGLSAYAGAPVTPVEYLQDLDQFGYLELVSDPPAAEAGEFLVPLGAIQKIRGVWAPRNQERVRGNRQAFTWRVLDGYTSAEVLGELEALLAVDERVQPLFSCDARSCGASVQWANRIFRERLLYGREDSQSYRVLTITADGREHRLMLYASARSSDRQYFHAELIALDSAAQ